jgi:alcohol dehydrogenase
MRTKAALLLEMGRPKPYAKSVPIVIEELELEGPGAGEVLVEMAAGGLCHSDLSVMNGTRPRPTPMVLGHEAAGVVREIGAGVSGLEPGDHVVFSYVPACRRCAECVSGRPAMCRVGAAANGAGTLLGGARRFKRKGQPVYHHLGVSGFSEYTVASQDSLVKIDPALPLDKAALFGCAIATGVGAVVNTARVEPGTSVAVFGLGGVGLAAVMGAKLAGAHPIVAVDVLASKFDLARKLGATHTVDANKDDPASHVREVTGGGAAYTFDATGVAKVLEQAFAATARGGVTVVIGLPHPDHRVTLSPLAMVAEERIIKGCYMGSAVPWRDIPRFIALYRAGALPMDAMITGTVTLEQINEGFDRLDRGEAVRQVLHPHERAA